MNNLSRLKELGINLRVTGGQTKTKCPQCSHTRKSSNKNEPCLSVNVDEGIYNCHNCGWQGCVAKIKSYVIPNFNLDKKPETWDDGKTQTQIYLNGRGISNKVIDEMHITEETQYIPKDDGEVKCMTFPYVKDGKVVNVKYRSLDKGFKMVSNAELVLYNHDALHDDKCISIIITEGEIDALSFMEAGFDEVVSVPNGASKGVNNLKYIENSAAALTKAKKYYLALDKDEAGEALLKELSRRLGKDKCFVIDYPDDCKDANDVLVKYGVKKLQDCHVNSRPLPIEGVIEARECKEGLYKLYDYGVDRGDQLGVTGFDTLLSFKTSMLYIITGIPTHGKSSFLNWIEAMLAARCKWKWAIFSPEHYPLEYLIYRYVEILTGKGFFSSSYDRMSKSELEVALKFINNHFYFIRPKDGLYTMSQLLGIAKSLVLRYGVKGFTIDPWNTIKHDYTSGMTETQYIEHSLNDITIFKQVHDVAVFLVAHPRKINKIRDIGHNMHGLHEVPTLYDVSGSKSFYDKSDVGLTVYRNFNTGNTTVYVQKIKFKHLGEVGMQEFKYIDDNSRYCPVDDAGNPVDSPNTISKEMINIQPEQKVIAEDWYSEEESKTEEEEGGLPF